MMHKSRNIKKLRQTIIYTLVYTGEQLSGGIITDALYTKKLKKKYINVS